MDPTFSSQLVSSILNNLRINFQNFKLTFDSGVLLKKTEPELTVSLDTISLYAVGSDWKKTQISADANILRKVTMSSFNER